jgi:AcrR family transcriptional regulator
LGFDDGAPSVCGLKPMPARDNKLAAHRLATPRDASFEKRRYHHGDLKRALIECAIEMIAAQGLQSFSVAQAARHIGVQISAPYRHFSDRDELLLAVAEHVCQLLADALQATQRKTASPSERLAAATEAFVGFAAENRGLYETLFAIGLKPDSRSLMNDAASPIAQTFLQPAMAVCRGRADESERLVVAIIASAHGYATLLFNGAFDGDAAVVAKTRATAATLALIAGRKRLVSASLGAREEMNKD